MFYQEAGYVVSHPKEVHAKVHFMADDGRGNKRLLSSPVSQGVFGVFIWVAHPQSDKRCINKVKAVASPEAISHGHIH